MAERIAKKSRIPAVEIPPVRRTRGLRVKLHLDDLDHRSRIVRTLKYLQEQLREYVGNANIISELLIQRIAYKAVRLSMYEVSMIQDPNPVDARHYLPFANSLRMDLQTLEKIAETAKSVPTIDEILAQAKNVGEIEEE